MKTKIILLLICLSQIVEAQIQTQKPLKLITKPLADKSTAINGMEVIKIPFPQAPTLHSDGGWEKGPSSWTSSRKFPLEYRGGLLLLNRNGMVHYLAPEIWFKEDGSIEISANSMGNSFIGLHPFKRIFGKKGEKKSLSVITKEAEFGTELNIYLKDFKPYKQQQVN
ncbi:MAG: hypothetical protein EOP00_02305 [Pedobacter sp.]|nr:MAG: hypothetical protein EOP00_02305 [Pedobacter sp.]